MIVGGDRLHVALPQLCGGPSEPQGLYALEFTIQTIGWPALSGGAALMVVAMMAPALAGPLLHLWYRSLSRHRWRAILLFITGYVAIWTIACLLLILTAYVLHGSTGSEIAASLVVASAGLAWQLSPARARCLARCHLRPRLSIFGAAAFTDPLLFGLTLACWCVATCWALMLLPLCLPGAHLPLMAGGALLVAIERTTQRKSKPSGLANRWA
ncbi:MAG: DUF2182 domain-containing protein [Mesorhizobium sp.]